LRLLLSSINNPMDGSGSAIVPRKIPTGGTLA
jgi:hypothetical protein